MIRRRKTGRRRRGRGMSCVNNSTVGTLRGGSRNNLVEKITVDIEEGKMGDR